MLWRSNVRPEHAVFHTCVYVFDIGNNKALALSLHIFRFSFIGSFQYNIYIWIYWMNWKKRKEETVHHNSKSSIRNTWTQQHKRSFNFFFLSFNFTYILSLLASLLLCFIHSFVHSIFIPLCHRFDHFVTSVASHTTTNRFNFRIQYNVNEFIYLFTLLYTWTSRSRARKFATRVRYAFVEHNSKNVYKYRKMDSKN